jgi:hypothetical protein
VSFSFIFLCSDLLYFLLEKSCNDLKSCNLNCAFGYKIQDNCEICSCMCVNEDNYFQEMRKSHQLETSKTRTSQFCKKSCVLGILSTFIIFSHLLSLLFGAKIYIFFKVIQKTILVVLDALVLKIAI